MKTKIRAKSVNSIVYLETVLKMGQYDRKKNKFLNPITHEQLAETFRYASSSSSYIKYRYIRTAISNRSNGKIVLPNISMTGRKRGRRLEVDRLIQIIESF